MVLMHNSSRSALLRVFLAIVAHIDFLRSSVPKLTVFLLFGSGNLPEWSEMTRLLAEFSRSRTSRRNPRPPKGRRCARQCREYSCGRFNLLGPKVAVDQSSPNAEINNRMAGSFALGDQVFLQTETTMVGRDSYSHA